MGRSSWFLMHYRPSNVSPKSRWPVKLAIRVRKTPILQIIGSSIASFPRQVRCHLPLFTNDLIANTLALRMLGEVGRCDDDFATYLGGGA